MAIDNSYTTITQAEMQEAAKLVKSKGGGSLLLAMAVILGEVADEMAKQCIALASQLDGIAEKKKNAGPGGAGDVSENKITAELQALTQKMNMFIQAMTNAIKTMGEADANLARKG